MGNGEADESAIRVGTPDQAAKFLLDLAKDESVRDEFRDRARIPGLLERYGIQIPEPLIPEQIDVPPQGLLLEALHAIGKPPEEPVPFLPPPPRPDVPFVPFAPVPFAPRSFGYWLVFLALHRASSEPPA